MACSDEEFMEAIREFPVLYNKCEKGYKDKNVVKNAWGKVIEKCGVEDIDEAQKRFGNIKKRFNNRRKKAKGPSGSGTADVQDASRKFQDMQYLAWLEPHVQLRPTKTNVSFKQLAAQQGERRSADESEDDEDDDDDGDVVDAAVHTSNSTRNEGLEEQLTDSMNEGDSTILRNSEEDLLFKDGVASSGTTKCRKPKTKKNVSETTKRTKWHQKEKDLDTICRWSS